MDIKIITAEEARINREKYWKDIDENLIKVNKKLIENIFSEIERVSKLGGYSNYFVIEKTDITPSYMNSLDSFLESRGFVVKHDTARLGSYGFYVDWSK